MAIEIISQRDPKWSKDKIGNTNLTIGRFGCTICSISMGTEYFSKIVNSVHRKLPSALAKSLLFTSGGLLIWSSLSSIGLSLKSRLDVDKTSKEKIDQEIKQGLLNPLTICLIEVDHAHWVLGIGKSLLGGYTILDPWDGKKTTTRKYKSITGCAIITIK